MTASTTPAAKPTIVLVHGAFADASGWSAEIQHLTKLGYPVTAPANPLRGVASDAHYIDTVLATIPGPVVLVGHSYGGAVIAAAANAAPNVKALVYVSAFIPEPGRSASYYTSGDNFPGSLLNQSTLVFKPTYNPTLSVTQPKPGETPKNNDADVYINPADFRAIFAADRSPAQAALMAAEQRPVSAAAYVENSYPAAKLPSWDLVNLDDKAIPPAAQQYMAQRAGARVTAIHSAHDSLITHPQVVDGLILQAAKSIRAPVPASKILLRRSGSSPCRADSFPSGMALDSSGQQLYLTDFTQGAVLEAPLTGGAATTWYAGPETTPTGHYGLGANGLKVHRGAVWIINFDQGTLLRIPLGSQRKAGHVQTKARLADGPDDFAFVNDGSDPVIAALDPDNQIVRINADASYPTLLTAADGLEGPTSVAVNGSKLYVFSAAYITTTDPNVLVTALTAFRH